MINNICYSIATVLKIPQGTDPEDVIKNAFGCFDENNSGVINEEYLRELLTSMGDRFTDEDVCIGAFFFWLLSSFIIVSNQFIVVFTVQL